MIRRLDPRCRLLACLMAAAISACFMYSVPLAAAIRNMLSEPYRAVISRMSPSHQR